MNKIKPIEGVMAADEYVLMRLPDSREVTVNGAYFSDLVRVDATRGVGPEPRRGVRRRARNQQYQREAEYVQQLHPI
jgi:hypothetical protein